MSNQQMVAVGVRLFCVWLAVYVLEDIPGLWFASQSGFVNSRVAVGVVIYAVIVVAILVALWLFPLKVARKLLPRSAREQPALLAPAEQLQSVGFCLLGLWLLTRAIPGLGFEAMVFHEYTRPGSTLQLRPREYADVVRLLIELALAVWMLFGARGLLGVLRWARSAGSGGSVDDRGA